MIRDPEIAALRTELERLGVVVAPHRDHLCVRLPLFASVRVRVDEQGRLNCEPMFGPLRRMHSFLVSTTGLMVLAGGALYMHAPAAPLLAFVAIMSGLGSVCRFVITENCVTRVQMLWAARQRAREAIPGPRAVELPAPDLASAQRATAESKR
jgi:hypothetical protein